MKKQFSLGLVLVFLAASLQAKTVTPDLSTIQDPTQWTVLNRDATFEAGNIYLKGKENEGLVLVNDLVFSNGKVEVDIKGKNDQGKSFVGIALHVADPTTYDAIYFRPFNFENPERKNHSVQYISMPFYGWELLRKNQPGEYENNLSPAPKPNDWFHVTILVNYPTVKVYVNKSKKPALEITQLSPQKKGKLGFFLVNNSEGWYKNLKVTPQ